MPPSGEHSLNTFVAVIAMLLIGLMFKVQWRNFVGRWQLIHTYQSDGKDLADGVDYLNWGAKQVR